MLRTYSAFCLLVLLPFSGFAQKNYKRVHNQMLDQAKLLYANEEYEDAAKIYRKLLPLDTAFAEVYLEMGVCLKQQSATRAEAIPLFEQAARHGHTEAFYELGLVRHSQHRFEEAIALFDRYKKLHFRLVRDIEVDRRMAMSRSARALMSEPVDVRISNMGPMINSTAHDYCPLVTADGSNLYFTSRRKGVSGEMKDATGQYFEDIYMARRIDDVWTNAVRMRAPINTRMHDATVGLNPDGSSMIIYRTHPTLLSGDLYESVMRNGQWSEPTLMTERINTKNHEPSASIAPGGDEIYFTSDRPGGFGGRDLYRIRRLPNGEWSLPLNLGPQVNTPYDEDAPFVHSDGVTLFFSSNGHNTMGGFDIFKTVLVDPDMNGWSDPENLGYPVNTVNDDIYFSLSDDGQTGFFSSEREEGLGMQDIYHADFSGNQLNYIVVRGVVTDVAEEPVKARIVVTDLQQTEVQGIYSSNDRTGRYLLVLTPGERYLLTVEARGFETQRSELHARTINGTRELPLDIQLVVSDQQERLSRNE
jgi:hypothetical protein